MIEQVNVIGAGLAGSEAAWQLAKRGIKVKLYEMRPFKRSPAHKSDRFAELVCSNSLRNSAVFSAIGLLKEELRRLGSIVMEAADCSSVPAGGALAVDRDLFSGYITDRLTSHPNIEVIREEVSALPRGEMTIVATGPLTSDALAEDIGRLIGDRKLYFYDAAAPIVDFSTVDMSKAFFASRYGKGSADYINCPMNAEEYLSFYNALINAECAHLHEFENDRLKVFEGCMPVEEMARRGEDTLRYGPLKPVGISNPDTGEKYYAVVQLRRENSEGTMFNIVGFQTHLTFPEQRRVFRMIPGLEEAEFLRYGVMHRNTYIASPGFLAADYSVVGNPILKFAGQMTGVEGYVESCASGFVAGITTAVSLGAAPAVDFSDKTMIGAMAKYVSSGNESGDFQPMNANFGIIAPLEKKIKGGKRPRYDAYAARALEEIDRIAAVIK